MAKISSVQLWKKTKEEMIFKTTKLNKDDLKNFQMTFVKTTEKLIGKN